MESKAGNGRRGRLSPAAATAVAAGAAATAVSCCTFVLWRLGPPFAAPLLVVSPVLVALAAWLGARRAVRAALEPAAAALERLAAQDFAAAAPVADFETAGLMQALERCRTTLSARHETTRAHAAVARLMGAGIGRLARGDAAVRIAVDLPEPYESFGGDFNAAAERLGTALADLDALRDRLDDHAAGLDEAATRLGKRAEMLAARVETDLRIIDALARHDPAEALRIARHTMQGVGVAARRNAEAAEGFAGLGRALREETTPSAAADDPAAPDARTEIAA